MELVDRKWVIATIGDDDINDRIRGAL